MKQPKRVRNQKGQFKSRKVSNLRFFVVMAVYIGLCYYAGQFVGYMDYMNEPRPRYYIAPVSSMDDMKVSKPDYEAIIKSQYNEIWDGERFVPTSEFSLVKEVQAAEEEPKTVEQLITEKFGIKAGVALAIAKCESGLREDAIGDRNLNPSSYGVFQVRAFKGRPSIDDLLQAEKNIEYAYKLSRGGTNWQPWSCYTRGMYKEHLW